MKYILSSLILLMTSQTFAYKAETVKGSDLLLITCDDGFTGYICNTATIADIIKACEHHGGIVIKPPGSDSSVLDQ